MLTPEELIFCSFTEKDGIFYWVKPDGGLLPMTVGDLLHQFAGYFDEPDLRWTIKSHLDALVESKKNA